MGKLVRLADLPRLREAASAAGRSLALANGIFDLFHVGHLRYLEGAKALADELVVAVNTDRSTRENKGPGRPVFPEAERAEIVAGLACVDHVVLFDSKDVVPVIRALRPDVHVKGTDYTPETIPERAEVERYGGRTAVAGDRKSHSTTETLAKLAGERAGKGRPRPRRAKRGRSRSAGTASRRGSRRRAPPLR